MGIQQYPFYVSRRIETMKQVIFACLLAVVAINSVDAKRGNKGKGRGKGKDAETGENMTEICKTAEVGSDMAFKCSYLAVMKTPMKDRTDEQKATGEDCREKRKEKMEAAGDKTGVKEQKVQKWKQRVKACRNIREAVKEGHAEPEQEAWAAENCKMKGGKKRNKKGGKKEEESAESAESTESESDAESDEKKKGGKGPKDGPKGGKNKKNKGKKSTEEKTEEATEEVSE